MSEQPAASINCGYTAGGLPIGLQIVGQRHDDLGVLQVARAWEQMRPAQRPWPQPPSALSRCKHDRRGNPVGTASRRGAGACRDRAVAHVLVLRRAARRPRRRHRRRPRLDAAARDAAGFLLTLTEPSLLADARAALDQADLLAANAPERERAHWAAADRCAAGDWHGACAAWEQILLDHPRDLYALQWAHLFDFYRGDARNLRGRVARVLPEWPRDDALRPYLLGMHAFGLEECNLYAQAEAVGREAVAGEAKVPWATHAVAHVMEMQGRFDEGRRWLHEQQPVWAEGNGFAGHHWWHLALFHLEAMDLRRRAGAARRAPGQRACGADAAAPGRRGAAVAAAPARRRGLGARWADLAEGWDLTPRDAGHSAFNDVHMLLALIGLRRRRRVRRRCSAAVQRRAERGSGSNAAMAREVGLPLMRGLLAFDAGDAAEAIRLLAPLRETAHRFGGSHAQRDLIDQTLLAACALPGGDRALGRALLNERRLARGAHAAGRTLARADSAWRRNARSIDGPQRTVRERGLVSRLRRRAAPGSRAMRWKQLVVQWPVCHRPVRRDGGRTARRRSARRAARGRRPVHRRRVGDGEPARDGRPVRRRRHRRRRCRGGRRRTRSPAARCASAPKWSIRCSLPVGS